MGEQELVQEIRARGWGDAFSAALDVLQPLAPLGAQLLWVAQPAAGLIGGWGEMIGTLARTLEEPGGIERLRQALEDEEAES